MFPLGARSHSQPLNWGLLPLRRSGSLVPFWVIGCCHRDYFATTTRRDFDFIIVIFALSPYGEALPLPRISFFSPRALRNDTDSMGIEKGKNGAIGTSEIPLCKGLR